MHIEANESGDGFHIERDEAASPKAIKHSATRSGIMESNVGEEDGLKHLWRKVANVIGQIGTRTTAIRGMTYSCGSGQRH
jgi:hypothetical protein